MRPRPDGYSYATLQLQDQQGEPAAPNGVENFAGIPEGQKALKARMESPEGQELLDELARCFVQAAVERLLKEQTIADVAQSSESI
jgi:hypothetical protein